MHNEGHNVDGLKKKIAAAIGNVRELKKDRQDTNAEIQAVRENMNALGIPKAAFDMAMRYLEWDEDKREGFDIAYALVREAGGAPMQEDLFQAADRMAAENAGKPEDGGEEKGPDAAEIAKVIASQENEATKGKRVLSSSAGAGTIN